LNSQAQTLNKHQAQQESYDSQYSLLATTK